MSKDRFTDDTDEDEIMDAAPQGNDPEEEDAAEATEGGFGSMFVDLNDDVVRQHLRGMFQSWYLDYASYTILDRAIPHIKDGLKPVQRRILHSMKTLDDGRFNKVANIVGNTMQYHPHGDASIYGALVQLGQKELLVETQGNWGNILTGASAAAGRYRGTSFGVRARHLVQLQGDRVDSHLRRPQAGTGDTPCEIPLAALAGSKRYRRRSLVADTAP